jgi:flagellar hook-length control protein FliK
MSEQISMPAGGGLLTLNLSISSQAGPPLGSSGALFGGFGAVLGQQSGQGTELAAGAFLPQSGISLPQSVEDGVLPDVTMQQKMLYIAQMLEQQYGDGAELPSEITAELAHALKQFAEQQSPLSTDEIDGAVSADGVQDDMATATVVGPPILLSDLEARFGSSALSDAIKATYSEMASADADGSDSSEVLEFFKGIMGQAGAARDTQAEEGFNPAPNAGLLDAQVSQRSGVESALLDAEQLARLKGDEGERAAQIQAQRTVTDTFDVAVQPLQRSVDEANKANKPVTPFVAQQASTQPNNEKTPSTVVSPSISDGVEGVVDVQAKKEPPIAGRMPETVDLMAANRQKEIAAELNAKSDTAVKSTASNLLPERFESALELSKQLLQKVTANEKASDSSFSQRMETLALAQNQTQQSVAMAQPSPTQKVVADAQNLMMPQQVQINTPAWKNALGERAIMVSAQNVNVAHIQLDPPELGSLSIRVHINQDQVSLSFTSPHAHVRDAVEQSLPRLREMFEEQGLSLQDSSVDDQSADQQRREQLAEQNGGAAGGSYMGAGEVGDDTGVSPSASKPLSLVDYYA